MQASAELAPGSERVGIELQSEHVAAAAAFGKVSRADIFRMNLALDIDWTSEYPLFVIGNPPWVTSAGLNRMESKNLPVKENFKGARGLEAVLGSSNFDVCEYIILKLISELGRTPFTLGMLCKTQVARNVIAYAHNAELPIAESAIYRIDAMKWFSASVDACWFTAAVDTTRKRNFTTAVFDCLDDEKPNPPRFGVVDGRMVADVERYEAVRSADSKCAYEWRSGLKHDASAVFELVATPAPATRAAEPLDLEMQYVFPFLKSTDVFRGRESVLSRWVIVPQLTFGADTALLEHSAPKLWKYLNLNSAVLDDRKSSIYRNRPRFSVFGHGSYTYAPYKVAISGLHKKPVFRLVAPINDRPVVLDDTCYFLPFDDVTEAALVWALLSSQPCIDLIESLAFWDAKRPITKKLLARIDLTRLPVDAPAIYSAAARQVERLGCVLDADKADAVLNSGAAESVLF